MMERPKELPVHDPEGLTEFAQFLLFSNKQDRWMLKEKMPDGCIGQRPDPHFEMWIRQMIQQVLPQPMDSLLGIRTAVLRIIKESSYQQHASSTSLRHYSLFGNQEIIDLHTANLVKHSRQLEAANSLYMILQQIIREEEEREQSPDYQI